MLPKFGKVQDIIHVQHQDSQQVLFCVEVFEGYCFSTHYNAFGVFSTSNVLVIDVHSLEDYHPLLVRKSFDISDYSLYIVMPFIV